MNLPTVAQVGKTALKIYTCHILVFTAGVAAGGIYVATAIMAALVAQGKM